MEKVTITDDKRFKDLSGREFGRLKVLYYAGKIKKRSMWWCECSCGAKKAVGGHNLKIGNTQSCGCLHKEMTAKTKEDLIGLKFGFLSVLKYAGCHKPLEKNKDHTWLCRCECGNTKNVRGASLKSGNTTSCGCHQRKMANKNRIDITGKRYGKLVVLSYETSRKGQTYWQCQCDCGNVKIIAGVNLRENKTISCGCYRKEARKTHGLSGKPGYKKHLFKDPVKKLRHNVSVLIRLSLKAKGSSKTGQSVFDCLPYTIDDLKKHLESLWEPWMNWDNYGGNSNDKRRTWHIDHIVPHSSFVYASMQESAFIECWALSNLRPLEKVANMSKGSKII